MEGKMGEQSSWPQGSVRQAQDLLGSQLAWAHDQASQKGQEKVQGCACGELSRGPFPATGALAPSQPTLPM